jgi:hypothetical protein
MSAALHFDITETLTADMLTLEQGIGRGTSLRHQIGGAVQRLTQDHLRKVNAEKPNQLGGIRTNFYAKAARATFFKLASDGLDLTIAQQGFRQRYEGGVIRPVTADWLSIPAVPEAHGKRPGEFSNLRFIPISDVLALLVVKEGGQEGRAPKRSKSGKVRNVKTTVEQGKTMFVLKKEVTQQGDPSIIPTPQQYSDTIEQAVADWVASIGGRN